jgi:hypothetical protein
VLEFVFHYLVVKIGVPGDVGGIKDTQAYGILMIGNINGLLKTQDFRVADVGAINE